MSKKRFPNWHPKPGDRALVPGGPACAQYVDVLTQDDVDAIENGHRGYTPLRLRMFGEATDPRNDGIIDVLTYHERSGYWVGNMVRAKNPSSMLRSARRYYGSSIKNIQLDV